MKQRFLIKQQIIRAWGRSIRGDYCKQRINSERSLQASFWSHLNQQLGKNRRLFIEPTVRLGTKRIMPDIVVCNSRSVIAAIELKYTPRAWPRFRKDIRSLAAIATTKRKVTIANDKYRGIEQDPRKYGLAESILFVWAGVHSKTEYESADLYSKGFPSLNGCYLELHAATRLSGAPKISYR
jgi:hypothetical protein